MLTVELKTAQGTFTQKLAKGESVLKAAWRAGLQEKGLGSCGGNCCCATCHMAVVSGGDLVSGMTSAEEMLLDMQDNGDEQSRLGCQMRAVKAGTLQLVWRGEDV